MRGTQGGPFGARVSSAAGLAACDPCLRRGALVGRLAPQVARRLRQPEPPPPRLLTLSDRELIGELGGGKRDAMEGWLRSFRPGRARSELGRAGVACVCWHHESYPDGLRNLDDPPAALYVAGGLARLAELTGEPMAAVVGARAATGYALEVATELGRGLSAAGVAVVSGLALGTDAAAHRGALRGGGRAVAVLAGGVDVVYPASHTALYRSLVEAGSVVSELPPGTRPARWSFPARNRIMAALARMTVVVEAQKGSGSLTTARFASDIGRDVGAVPGRVTGSKAAGSNGLLRDGASVVCDAGDVLDSLFGIGGRLRGEAAGAAACRSALDPPVRRVLAAVEAGLGVDAIPASAALPAADVRAALGRLELLGLVHRDGVGAYQRAAG